MIRRRNNYKVDFNPTPKKSKCDPEDLDVHSSTKITWTMTKPGYTFHSLQIDNQTYENGSKDPTGSKIFGGLKIRTSKNKSVMSIIDTINNVKDYKYTINYFKNKDPGTILKCDPRIRNQN